MNNNRLNIKEILYKMKSGEISSQEGLGLIKKIKESNLKVAQPLRTDDKAVWFKWNWNQLDMVENNNELINTGNLLVFDTDKDLFEKLKMLNMNSKAFDNIVLVLSASSYSKIDDNIYEININELNDYRNLINDLKIRGILPCSIVHNLCKKEFSYDGEALNSMLQDGILSLFLLTESLLYAKQNSINLLFTCQKTQPQYSGVSGFIKTLHKENASFNYRILEINLDSNMNLAEILTNEFKNDDGAIEILYEDGIRYVRKLEEVDLTGIKDKVLPIVPKGVYIITGGLGGVGKILAQYLSGAAMASLVIVGRSDLKSQNARFIDQLRMMGSEVLYYKADITKKSEVDRLVKDVREKFGVINGVIHCAGVLSDGMIIKKTSMEFANVIAPKVYGTVFLDEATANDKLDFFVCFSSIAVMGNIGQSDYAYANRFMDDYMDMRNSMSKKGKHHGKSISINWPLWGSGKMQISEEFKRQMKDKMGVVPLDNETGVRAFCDAIRSDTSQLMVLAGAESVIKDAVLGEFKYLKPENKQKVLPVHNSDVENSYKNEISDQNDRTKTQLEVFLKNILAEETGLPSSAIMPNEAFEAYGINSVVIIGLNQKLEGYFGSLPKTLLFECKNISELSAYFMENHFDKVSYIAGNSDKLQSTPKSDTQKADNSSTKEKLRFLKTNTKEDKTFATSHDEIAIIGVSGRYPMSDDLEQFWEALKEGKDCITEIPEERWDLKKYFNPERGTVGKSYSKWGGFINGVDQFDPLFFNISPREAEIIDPQERHFLEIVWQAVEDAGYTRQKLDKDKVGVFVGAMYGHYQLYGTDPSVIEEGLLPNTSYASIANRASYFFNFRGPSIAVDTMCSSSLTSIHLACSSIDKNECDLAIAGGVNLTVHPNKYLLLSQGQFLSSDGKCRSFGDSGDGYVPGEGVGAVVLKSLSKAIEDGDHIYAVIKGSLLNHGGKTNGYTVPNPNEQGDLIARTLKLSGVDPRSISYIEAHGTGTSLGDPIEIAGLMKAFNPYTKEKQFCSIGSVKSNIGHLESAAGIAGITKIILQMKYKKLVPSIHAETLNKNINFEDSQFRVQRELDDWHKPVMTEDGKSITFPRRAAISSFGAGGSNAHIIIEEWEESASYEYRPTLDRYLILLSAKNKERLKAYAERLLEFIEKGSKEPGDKNDLTSIAYTLQTGREAMDERLAIVVSSINELNEKLSRYIDGSTELIDIYQGNTKQAQNSNGFLIEGRAGNEFIKAIIEDKLYNRLAQLWVSGLNIEWELLYKNTNVKKISLPTYPFERGSYWIKSGQNVGLNQGTVEKLHSIIERNTSTLDEERFTTRLTGEEFYLADYIKGANNLLPQIVTLEMARAAGQLAVQHNVTRIKDVVWGQPIRFDAFPVDIHVSFYKNGDAVEYEVGSIDINGQRIAYSQGEICFDAQPDVPKKPESIDVDSIMKRCADVQNKDDHYSFSYPDGKVYGSSFRVIKELYFGENEILADLELQNEIESKYEDFLLHPVFLEGALQSVMGYLNNIHLGHVISLDKIDEIEIFETFGDIKYAYLSLVAKHEDMRSAEFSVDFADYFGNIIIKIKGFTVSIQAQDEIVNYRQKPKARAVTREQLDDSDIRKWIVKNIKEVISDILKIEVDKLDEDEGFGNFGFESIALKQLADTLSDKYGIELSPAVFFDQSNINGLGEYLLREHREKMLAAFGGSVVVERVDTKDQEFESSDSDKSECVYLEPLMDKFKNSRKERFTSSKGSIGNKEPIAVIGMSGMFPLSKDLEEFWNNLELEKDLITEVPEDRWSWKDFYSNDNSNYVKTKSKWGGFVPDVDKFDPRFFNISPAEAEMMDPQQRLFLEAVWKAIEDAGYKASELSGRNVGVFAGIQFKDYQQLLAMQGESNAMMGLGNEHSIFVNRISYLLNFHGPSEPYDTACSSTSVAIHRAIRSIWLGESELAIAGGISLMLSPSTMISADQLGILSSDGKCKTLDKSANGYVKGEGLGALLLKPLSKAIKDNDNIYAVIKGSAVNHGGKASSLTAPNSAAQASMLVSAYEDAGVDPETVTYLELHGTGTELGDPVEIEGIKSAFKQLAAKKGKEIKKRNFCGIGSVKTNIGHLEPASGIAGIIKIILSMKHKKLPGILHLKELNPYINLDNSPFYVTKGTKFWERITDEHGNVVPRIAGVSSFGFGGVNSHIVIEEYERRVYDERLDAERIIVLSAKNADRLKEYASKLLEFLRKEKTNPNYTNITQSIVETNLIDDVMDLIAQTAGLDVEDLDPLESIAYQGFDQVLYSGVCQKILQKYNIDISPTFITSFKTFHDFIVELYKENKITLDKYYSFAKKSENGTNNQGLGLCDIAFTLQTGREEMSERIACVVSNIDELIEKLTLFTQDAVKIDNFFRGSTKVKGQEMEFLSDFIMDSEDGKKIIASMMEKRKLDKLAKYWTLGGVIDWRKLYSSETPYKVSLPTYPFARERYWAPKSISELAASKHEGEKGNPTNSSNMANTANKAATYVNKPDSFKQKGILNGAPVNKPKLPPELLPINTKGAHQPSFWVHGAPGFATFFTNLSTTLGSDYPMYCFQARGVDNRSIPRRFDDAVDHYIECIRIAQPEGPYIIGGYSFGGIIAYEMARRMSVQGDEITKLIMFDAFPATDEVIRRFYSDYERDFFTIFIANEFANARENPKALITKQDFEGVPEIYHYEHGAKLAKERGGSPLPADEIYNYIRGAHMCSDYSEEAYKEYDTLPYEGSDVLFFKATRGYLAEDNWQKWRGSNLFEDYDYIKPWKDQIKNEMQIVELPSDHFCQLDPPSIHIVTKHLKEIIPDNFKPKPRAADVQPVFKEIKSGDAEALMVKTIRSNEEVDKKQSGDEEIDYIIHELKLIVAEKMKISYDEIDEDVNVAEYGVDSILSSFIMQMVQEKFGNTISLNAIVENPTLRQLAYHVRNESNY